MNKEKLKQKIKKDINLSLVKLLAKRQTKGRHSNRLTGGEHEIYLADNLVYNHSVGYIKLDYFTDGNISTSVTRECCKGDEYNPKVLIRAIAGMFADLDAKLSFYRLPYKVLLRECLKNDADLLDELFDFVEHFSNKTIIVLEYTETRTLESLDNECPIYLIRGVNEVYIAHMSVAEAKIIYLIDYDKIKSPEGFFEFLDEIACRMILPRYLNWSKL